jgi:hypothetical protein
VDHRKRRWPACAAAALVVVATTACTSKDAHRASAVPSVSTCVTPAIAAAPAPPPLALTTGPAPVPSRGYVLLAPGDPGN